MQLLVPKVVVAGPGHVLSWCLIGQLHVVKTTFFCPPSFDWAAARTGMDDTEIS